MPFNADVKAVEEMAELIVVIAKKMMYPHTDHHPDGGAPFPERFTEEIGDVEATLEKLKQKHQLTRIYISKRRCDKLDKFDLWERTEKFEDVTGAQPHFEIRHGGFWETSAEPISEELALKRRIDWRDVAIFAAVANSFLTVLGVSGLWYLYVLNQ